MDFCKHKGYKMTITPFIEEFINTVMNKGLEEDDTGYVTIKHNLAYDGKTTSAIICGKRSKNILVHEVEIHLEPTYNRGELVPRYWPDNQAPDETKQLENFLTELESCNDDHCGLYKIFY